VNTNAHGLDETQQCIEEFYDTLSDVVGAIQRYEDRLSSHRALGAAARYRRHFDKIRVSADICLCVSQSVVTVPRPCFVSRCLLSQC